MSQPTFLEASETSSDAANGATADASTYGGRPESSPAHVPGGRGSVMPPAPKVTRPAKSQYSESEAAAELGISVDALRQMIRSHVVDSDQDASNIPVTTFQPSDLLVLRLLAGQSRAR